MILGYASVCIVGLSAKFSDLRNTCYCMKMRKIYFGFSQHFQQTADLLLFEKP